MQNIEESCLNAVSLPAGLAPRLNAIRTRYRIGPDAARDVLQKAFIKLIENQDEISNRPAWFLTVFRNLCVRYVEDRCRSRERKLEFVEVIERKKKLNDSSDEVFVAEVSQALNALPVLDRLALEGRYLLEEDYSALGASLGVAPATARNKVSAALKKLREALF